MTRRASCSGWPSARTARLLAAAGADGTLRLWNVAAPGHPVLVSALLPADSSDPLYAAEFSPDGKLLAAAGAGRVVTLWEISGTKAVRLARPLSGPAATAYSIAFSPDSATLAAASTDGTIRLWHVADPAPGRADGAPLVTPGGTYPNSVAFSPDGRTLAAGTNAGTVWLWHLPGTAALAAGAAPAALPGMPLTGPANSVSGVAFSPDGEELAASSKDLKVWLWRVGPAAPFADGTLTGSLNWVNTVAFSPDGRSLAAGTSGANVLVWSLATRRVTAKLPHPQPVTSVTWDGPDRIAAASADGTVSLWALPSAVLVTGSAPTQLAYAPGGGTLAVGGDGSVQLWDTASRTLLASRALPRDDVRQRDGVPPARRAGGAAPRGRGLERNGRVAQREHAGPGRASPHGDQRTRGRRIGGVQPGRPAAGHRRGRRVRALVRRDRPRAPPAAHGGRAGQATPTPSTP